LVGYLAHFVILPIINIAESVSRSSKDFYLLAKAVFIRTNVKNANYTGYSKMGNDKFLFDSHIRPLS
jgi:hypothetical protein